MGYCTTHGPFLETTALGSQCPQCNWFIGGDKTTIPCQGVTVPIEDPYAEGYQSALQQARALFEWSDGEPYYRVLHGRMEIPEKVRREIVALLGGE